MFAWGGEEEREKELALGLLLCHSPLDFGVEIFMETLPRTIVPNKALSLSLSLSLSTRKAPRRIQPSTVTFKVTVTVGIVEDMCVCVYYCSAYYKAVRVFFLQNPAGIMMFPFPPSVDLVLHSAPTSAPLHLSTSPHFSVPIYTNDQHCHTDITLFPIWTKMDLARLHAMILTSPLTLSSLQLTKPY